MARSEARKGGRSGFYWILILIVLLIGGYIAYYLYVRSETVRYVDEWIADMERDGYEIEYAAREITGFPFLVKAEFTDPSITDTIENMSWKGERVWLALRPWNFFTYLGNAPGKNEIRLANGDRYEVELGRDTRLSYGMKMDGVPERISLRIDEAVVTSAGRSGEITGLIGHVGIAPDDEKDIRVTLDFEGLTLPNALPGAEYLGRDLSEVSVRMILDEAVPAIESGSADPVRYWLENDGRVGLGQLDVTFGPLDLEANADLGADARGRLDGIMNLRLLEGEALKAALSDAGLLDDQVAGIIDGLVSVARNGDIAPLTFRNGQPTLLGMSFPSEPVTIFDF